MPIVSVVDTKLTQFIVLLQWKEFFFFAGLMFADMIVFSYLAYRYQPADPNVLLANLDDEKDKDEGNDNDAYEGDKQR